MPDSVPHLPKPDQTPACRSAVLALLFAGTLLFSAGFFESAIAADDATPNMKQAPAGSVAGQGSQHGAMAAENDIEQGSCGECGMGAGCGCSQASAGEKKAREAAGGGCGCAKRAAEQR